MYANIHASIHRVLNTDSMQMGTSIHRCMLVFILVYIHKVLNTGRMQTEEEGAVYGLMFCCLTFG